MPGPEEPPIANFDKIAHFGFFFGGSGLLCAYLYRRQTGTVNWKKLILTAVIIISIVGALDEYHQSFTPGRTGNDQYDWLADILGGISGAFIFKFLHRWLK
ncbi:MAG: VanZ family protein [Akkermansiaceae bacterium]|nr:VanZ family protein [Akkermansiaceae bacterium]